MRVIVPWVLATLLASTAGCQDVLPGDGVRARRASGGGASGAANVLGEGGSSSASSGGVGGESGSGVTAGQGGSGGGVETGASGGKAGGQSACLADAAGAAGVSPICADGACLITPPRTVTKALGYLWAASASDVWAVGDARVEHWAGQGWTRVDIGTAGSITGVAGLAADDVWVSAGDGLFHFDGTSWNHTVSDPDPNYGETVALQARGGSLLAMTEYGGVSVWHAGAWATLPPTPISGQTAGPLVMAASGPADVWVFDTACPFAPFDSCFEWVSEAHHWDGTAWNDTLTDDSDAANPEAVEDLRVLAVGPDDAWVIRILDGESLPGVRHWDGKSWTNIAAALPPHLLRFIDGKVVLNRAVWTGTAFVDTLPTFPVGDWWDMAGVSLDDLWLVGPGGRSHLHCGEWETVPSWAGPTVFAGTGASDAWGLKLTNNGYGPTGVMHWDGTSWSNGSDLPPNPWNGLAVAGDQIWLSSSSGKMAKRAAGAWQMLDGPPGNYVDSLTVPVADDVWVASTSGVWRGDGLTWTQMSGENVGWIAAAGPNAVWAHSFIDGECIFWDAQGSHDETALDFGPLAVSQAPDGTVVAYGETLFTQAQSYRVRTPSGWSDPLPIPMQSIGAPPLWARSKDDIWTADAHAIGRLHDGVYQQLQLDDDAQVNLIWGDDDATYFGTVSGAIWRMEMQN